VPEVVEYDMSSFIFRARVPFHPKRLYDLVSDATRCAAACVRAWSRHRENAFDLIRAV
jgi:hypothetical protein